MRSAIGIAALIATVSAGAVGAEANTVLVPYSGSFDESTVAAEGGLPAGDYDTIGGAPDVGQFNLVGGNNTFTGTAKTGNPGGDSSDSFIISVGANQTLTGASIQFGTNLDDFHPAFASPAPHFVLSELSGVNPPVFDIPVGFTGLDHLQTFSAPAFTLGPGLYSVLFGNGTFARLDNAAIGYVMSFTVAQQVAQTPIPAALPLFTSGLGVMGFAAWRRARKLETA
jgi:hypothetical protein